MKIKLTGFVKEIVENRTGNTMERKDLVTDFFTTLFHKSNIVKVRGMTNIEHTFFCLACRDQT